MADLRDNSAAQLAEGIHNLFPALTPLRLLGPTALLQSLITTMLVGRDQPT
ncbi:hypothetical protein I553_2667 [Mycobacterium xenopi 4042]|uniref:Uncharacterized protein n=1 Tax=Mycobacterium xenopi 4042 TaxID=1299334 RepID=X8BK65_MYCXE|nr:hypothetical protein I553_2667 [Mycobacterium xenopi 4042]